MNQGDKAALKKYDYPQSWLGLDDVVPESFKDDVRRFLDEANERTKVMLDQEADLKRSVRRKITKQKEVGRGKGKLEKNQPFLAARRRLILQCLSIGMTYEETRIKLGLQVHTLQNDLEFMRRKFRAATTIEIVCRALRGGFIE